MEKLLAALPKTPILIPVKCNCKKPDVPQGESWKEAKYHLTPQQAVERLKMGKNVGIVATDWLVIVDLDDPQKYTLQIETLTVQTRNGKLHKYFLNAGDVKNAVGKKTLAKCGEVRADWQYVLAAGSYVPTDEGAHANANGLYRVINCMPAASLRKDDLPLDFVPTEETRVPDAEVLTKPVPIRNKHGVTVEEIRKKDTKLDRLLTGDNLDFPSASEADMSVLSKLVHSDFAENEAVAILKQYRNRDKLSRDDYILGMLAKINAENEMPDQVEPKEEPKQTDVPSFRKKDSQADKLVKLFDKAAPELFIDQTDAAYARINKNGVTVTVNIRQREFKEWLSSLLWQSEQKAPGMTAIYAALNVIGAKARDSGNRHVLYNRVAPDPDSQAAFWLDLCDKRWRAIKVTADGWQIVETPPILFKRYSHQLPIVEPKSNGDPTRLLQYFNIDPKDENTPLTLMTYVVSCLVPNIPHPVIVVSGRQGSAKSSMFRFIRRLIDPSIVELLSLPMDERERVQQLDHHWLAYYDNVTRLPIDASDCLCRAATGGGFTKRTLYTDDDDTVYDFRRCPGLNGINIAAQRGDLLDRALLVTLTDIPTDKRRTEKEMLIDFGQHKAEILGGLLDTLSKAIRIYPTVNPGELFRMADFTRWGVAISIALGKTQAEFIRAYDTKVKTQIEEAANASPVATVLMDFMESRPLNEENNQVWQGTPTELHTALVQWARSRDISTHQKGYPKAPHILTRQLEELAPSLKALGWEVTTGLWIGKRKNIYITSVGSVGNTPKPDAANASNATSPIVFSSVVRLHTRKCGECLICHAKGAMDWQATQPNGSCGFLCVWCGLKQQNGGNQQ